jgi:4-hydroxy-2-oxoheptanedioate aldolase
MTNRLHELLNQHKVLYGAICRDSTLTDIELLAQTGYHVLWIDLEHGGLSLTEAVRLCRTIVHLGMIPLARISELQRDQVQSLLDGGFQILVLPGTEDARQAAELVRLSKFPPRGERGLSSTSPGIGFSLGDDLEATLREADDAIHLMVQLESDEGLANLDAILQVEGIDMVTVGPLDWAVSRGLFEKKSRGELDGWIDGLLSASSRAGKLTAMVVADAQRARRYVDLGVRLLFVGVDVALKRKVFAETLARFQESLGGR